MQDAHEAVRPTDVTRTPESLRDQLDPGQHRLYDLIWRRFVASQMAAARFLNTRASLAAGDYLFRATGSVLQFDGFQKVWKRDEEKDEGATSCPALDRQRALPCVDFRREQHFTQPPPRYTEASLIKELEERGIGRPSTYAPTIEVIQERNYVRQEERRLHPTELGKTVDGVLREHFPAIVDVAFTAEMEKRLDGIEEGTRQYEPTIREWYDPFAETLSKAEATWSGSRFRHVTPARCARSAARARWSSARASSASSPAARGYPECDYIKDRKAAAEPTGEMCPRCGKPLVLRQGRRGPFVGCSGYPTCRYIKGDARRPAADGAAARRRRSWAVPAMRQAAGTAHRAARDLRGLHRLPVVQVHPAGLEPGRLGGRRPPPSRPVRTCPDCGKPLSSVRAATAPSCSCSGYPGCKYRPPKSAAPEKVAAT